MSSKARSGKSAAGAADLAIDDAESLILWAMREWMSAYGDRRCATAAVIDVFECLGKRSALGPLNRLMALLAAGSRRELTISRDRADGLSIDEKTLLEILRAARNLRHELVRERLRQWLPGDAVEVTANAVSSLAVQFGVAETMA